MPTAPELLRVAGLVRRIEVLGQIEAHQQRHADSNIRITRKVGVHLHRIGEQRKEILKAREQHRTLEHTVDKVHRQIVGQNDLLQQAVAYPEHSYAELPAGEKERLVQLRHKLRGTDDRTGHQLREE